MAPEKVLQSTMHLNSFVSWNVDARVYTAVQATCFRWFLDLQRQTTESLRQNWQLITALVYFYKPEDHCFVFETSKQGERKKSFSVDFGLEDVLYIMGLPIDGMPTTGLESAHPIGVIRTHLNLSESKAKELLKVKKGKVCYGISLIELKKVFEEVPEECHGLSLEPYVKAYLLYLLGQVVFPNASRTIAAMYLPLLDLQKINDYAWGAAAIATLKVSMGKAKVKLENDEAAYLGGFSYALMVFALERFPCLRGSFVRPKQFPLFLGWISILTPSLKDTQNVTGVKEYRKRLKKMKERDVTWQPYSLAERTMVLPAEWESQMWMKYACIPCICFEQISINPTDKCFKQLGLKRKDLRKLPPRQEMKLIQQSKHKGKNWKNYNKNYKHFNNQWRMRNMWLVNKNYEFVGKLLNDDDDEEKEKVTKENVEGADLGICNEDEEEDNVAEENAEEADIGIGNEEENIAEENVEGADLGICNEDEEEDEDENVAEENAEEADIGIGNEDENIAEENVEGVDLEIGESHQNIPSAESPQPAHVNIRKYKRKHTEMTCPDKQRRSTRVVVPSLKISLPYVGAFYGRKASVEVTINSDISKPDVKKNERKLLVFDMNGILVHIVDPTYPCRHKPDKVVKRKKVYMRPNCQDFLECCLQKFDIAIWSSRTRENLESVVDLFPNLRARLIFCWSQEDCEVISRKGDPGKPTFIKRLEKVWEVHKQYNETNTLLVDDSPCKAICNPANTGIFPPSYDCKITNDKSLGPEGDIRMYLDHLAEAENVKEYVKMNPFGLPPITESHADWNYYQDLLKQCLKEN